MKPKQLRLIVFDEDEKKPCEKKPHKKDPAWEALIEATRAMEEMERGPLNTALKAIRAQCARDGLHEDEIPDEIRRRAQTYRDVEFVGLTITPTALAKHWNRCVPPPPVEKRETLPEIYARLKRQQGA
jgi:hypothetical protein